MYVSQTLSFFMSLNNSFKLSRFHLFPFSLSLIVLVLIFIFLNNIIIQTNNILFYCSFVNICWTGRPSSVFSSFFTHVIIVKLDTEEKFEVSFTLSIKIWDNTSFSWPEYYCNISLFLNKYKRSSLYQVSTNKVPSLFYHTLVLYSLLYCTIAMIVVVTL